MDTLLHNSRRNNYFIFRNLAAIKTAQELARDFPNIKFILLKGAALFSFAHNDKSDDKIFLLRPTEDVDILLPEKSGDDNLLMSRFFLLLEKKGYRKIKSDSQTFRKFTAKNCLLPIDFHRRIWYIPDDKTHERIIGRAVPAGGGEYPPNLLRLKAEDLWVDIAVHSVFHHTLRPYEKAADLDFLESVCPMDKRIVVNLLDGYFGADARDVIIDSVREDKWKDLRSERGEEILKNYRYLFYKKFIASDFPAKGFAARCFLVRGRGGITDRIKFFMREVLFPPTDFIRRRYDLKSPVAVRFFQLIRPFIVGAKAAASLLFLKTGIPPFSNK